MSTRAQIGVYKSKNDKLEDYESCFYKHWDGYPDGVLPVIVPLLKRFDGQRGMNDTEYCSAWLLWSLVNDHVKNRIELNENKELTLNERFHPKDGIDGLGYGVCCRHGFHGDIEFFYKVYPSAVDVYECHYSDDPNKWELTKTVEIKKESDENV